jgi:hypothetical protein
VGLLSGLANAWWDRMAHFADPGFSVGKVGEYASGLFAPGELYGLGPIKIIFVIEEQLCRINLMW